MAKRMRARRGLAGVSTSSLESELQRRRSGVRVFERKRDRLMTKLAALERKIQEHGGSAASGGAGRRTGGRPKNTMNLVEALAGVLKGRTMSVTDVSAAVQRAGYKTSSANFRTIVNQTLIKSGKFKKISRGQYTAK